MGWYMNEPSYWGWANDSRFLATKFCDSKVPTVDKATPTQDLGGAKSSF